MDFFDSIHGNDKQKNFFRSRIEEGKLSHAYILEAPQGGGKKMFALCIAATLASLEKTSPKERDEKCRRILEGLSPDVRILSRSDDGKKTIGVSAVRDFMASVYLAPSELGFKMYLFDEADRITPQAQNALLKVIEEPCKDVYLFLLCENSLSMLATVRSRAQKILLQTFGEQELAVYAREKEFPGSDNAERLDFAVRMANGAIGRLHDILENGESEFSAYTAAKKTITGQAMKNRGATYHTFLKGICDFAQSRDIFEAFTGYLLAAYSELARAGLSESYMPEFWTEEEAQSYAMTFAADTIEKSFAAAEEIRSDLRFNTNLSLAAATLATALWNAV